MKTLRIKRTFPITAFITALVCTKCDCESPNNTTSVPTTNINSQKHGENSNPRKIKNNNQKNYGSGKDNADNNNNEQAPTDEDGVSPNPSNHTPGGLINLGNTCYMNATLQVVARLELFRPSGNNDIDNSLRDISRRLSKNEFISRSNLEVFYEKIINLCGFRQKNQEDAGELLTRLFDDNRVSQELNFKTKETMRCSMNHVWDKPEMEDNMLHISIINPSLQDNLDAYFAEENLNGANQVECTACGGTKKDAKSCLRISALPKKLIIQLNRFLKNGPTITKDETKLSGTEILKLRKKWVTLSSGPMADDITYVLKGVIIHTGTFEGGHYYSLIKNTAGDWIEYNDEAVSKVTSTEGLENGYIYIYERS